MIEDEDHLRTRRRVDMVEHLGHRTDRERLCPGSPLLDELAAERGRGRLQTLDLAAGELEHARAVGRLRTPSLNEEASGIEPDEAGGDEESGLLQGHRRGIAHAGRFEKQRLSSGKPMRLYANKVSTIRDAIARALLDTGDIEVSNREEFKADIESVLKEYRRKDREITESAKDILEQRGLPYSELFRTKRQLAEADDFALGDDSVQWITNQMLELFMQSQHVDEIYVDDSALRRTIRDMLRRHMQADEDVDREVRLHLKHLSDNTEAFEIEYQKQLDMVKRKHGLE